jgi:hypothetical protein
MGLAPVPVLKDEAKAAAKAAAWVPQRNGCDHCTHLCGPIPQPMLHVRGEFTNDVWTLAAVLRAVDKSKQVVWAWNLFDHDLAFRDSDGKVWRVSVSAPVAVKKRWKKALDDAMKAPL